MRDSAGTGDSLTPASSLDSPARADPERHRRCPPFELFFDGRSRKKQRNSTFNTDRKNGFDERFWQKLYQKKQPGFLWGRVHIWFNTRLIRVDVEKQWTSITVRGKGRSTSAEDSNPHRPRMRGPHPPRLGVHIIGAGLGSTSGQGSCVKKRKRYVWAWQERLKRLCRRSFNTDYA